MKQILHDFRSGQVVLADVPRPEIAANSVLVQNLFSVVSPGTERAVMRSRSRNVIRTALERKDLVHRVLTKMKRDGIMSTLTAVGRKLDSSLPLGYSCAGIVLEVGSDVTDIKAGDRVACAGAGFASHAEIVCIPRLLCAPIPEGVPPDAAAFATLGAIAMQGVRQAEPTLGEYVAVIGLGILGQIAAQITQAAGARVIGLDINAQRVELFSKVSGATGVVIGPETERRILDLTEGRGPDRVIITAASQSEEPMNLAASICRDRGRIVVVGDVAMRLPRPPFYEKELDLRMSRSYGPGRYDATYEIGGIDYPIAYVRWTENRNMDEFLRLVGERRVRLGELITHRIPIGQAAETYNKILSGEVTVLGAVIEYPARPEAIGERRVGLRSTAAKPKDKVGIALLGAGNFARSTLLPEIAKIKSAKLVAIGSARGVTARDLGNRYGCSFATTDFNEMLASPEVDAVVIATPHNQHAEQAIRCLKAGKAVYLEKPMCILESELEPLVAAVKEAKRCFFVGHNRRFAPMGLRMRQAFAGRRTPLVIHYRVNAGRIPPGSWITSPDVSGGRVVGECSHFVDFIKSIVGRPVRQTVAQCTGETPDDIVCQMQFDDGSIATLSYVTSGPSAYGKERVEAFGQGSVSVIDDFRQWTFIGDRKSESDSGATDKGHGAALTAFVECVAGRAEPAFDIDDLAGTARITFAMKAAAGAQA